MTECISNCQRLYVWQQIKSGYITKLPPEEATVFALRQSYPSGDWWFWTTDKSSARIEFPGLLSSSGQGPGPVLIDVTNARCSLADALFATFCLMEFGSP